ncbi:MAG: hypothetical protein QOJ00_825 [Actinomycetota bacterium]|jgi:hypothetical protein
MKQLALALVALVVGMATVPLISSVGAADGLDGLVTAEAESYALRVEYDIPLPAGPGTIPYTVGEIRRTTAGENAKGLAAAPSGFGAVVAGQYVNPNHEFDDPAKYNHLPQAECFYPGDLVDTHFRFPTETRDETNPLPPLSFSTARCSAGPVSDLKASTDGFGGTGVVARNLASSSLMQTVKGVDKADTSSHASAIEIAGGAVKIGGVDISSSSSVTGKKGGAVTGTRLTISDVAIGPLTFSIADDRLVVAGQNVPLVGDAAQGIVDQANTLLTGSGCRVDVIDNPGRYPQGYLFARPDPKVGVAGDGSFAGSMRAGLLVVCDLPESVTPKNLTPQRVQVVVGFAYSSASATADPGGFGIGDLTGGLPESAPAVLPNLDVAVPSIGDVPLALAPPTPTPAKRRPAVAVVKPVLPIATTPLNSATRLTLFLACAVAWALLTHFGIDRLRRTP